MTETYYIIKNTASDGYWSGKAWAKSIKRAMHFKNMSSLRQRLIYLKEELNCKPTVLKYTVTIEEVEIQ